MATEAAGAPIHIVEPFAEILYSDRNWGNVDTRPNFGAQANDAEEGYHNRQELLRLINPGRYVLQKVQMKADFVDLSEISDPAGVYTTDGLIIDRPGIALGLNPADCNALTMYDAVRGSVLGLIHVGRQGADGDIHLKALEHITDSRWHQVPKEDLRIHFAPSVRHRSYHYPDTPEQIYDPRWKGHIYRRKRLWHVDLVGRVVRDLVDNGIEPEQMKISPIDVGANTDYFSHVRSRRTGETQGRNGVVAMLRS
jgi:copper oxidase (laccase) domain-containing protein